MKSSSQNSIEAIQRQIAAQVAEERESFEVPFSSEQESSPDDLWRSVQADQDGAAWLFCQLHKNKLAFDHAAGLWYRWNGHHWVEDRVEQAIAEIDSVIEQYSGEASRWGWLRLKYVKEGNWDREAEAKAKEETYVKRVRQLQHLHYKKCVLTLAAAGEESLGITGDEWDGNPWLLGVANGVVDLKTGEFREGQPDDFIKTFSPTSWRGLDAVAPTWDRFITDILNGDLEIKEFVHRLLGYSIVGITTEHILAILWGERGRNGKGTLLETAASILGPLAGPVQSELLLDQSRLRSTAAPASDILALRGRRLAWASETNEGRRFDTSKVKWLVGGDTLCGRQPYGKREISFKPTHTLFLLTNRRPRADAGDDALFQRLLLIPFNLHYVDNPKEHYERKKDSQLTDKLMKESSGILAWFVRGCLQWQKQGLDPPPSVRTAIAKYRESEDLIGHFINDRCVVNPSAKAKAGALYRAYQEWCLSNGHRPLSGTKFGEKMKDRFEAVKTNVVIYFGVGILDGETVFDTLDT